MSELIGKKVWAFAGGHIPLWSGGKEPEFTSHDKISVLNASAKDAKIKITVFYENEEAVKYHTIKVSPRRVRKIRFNDLIDPRPILLDRPYGFLLASNVEVIVQFSRMNTGSKHNAGFCFTPYFKPDNYE